jgi:hypothetical protein
VLECSHETAASDVALCGDVMAPEGDVDPPRERAVHPLTVNLLLVPTVGDDPGARRRAGWFSGARSGRHHLLLGLRLKMDGWGVETRANNWLSS